jgi:periplasmic protein TonB
MDWRTWGVALGGALAAHAALALAAVAMVGEIERTAPAEPDRLGPTAVEVEVGVVALASAAAPPPVRAEVDERPRVTGPTSPRRRPAPATGRGRAARHQADAAEVVTGAAARETAAMGEAGVVMEPKAPSDSGGEVGLTPTSSPASSSLPPSSTPAPAPDAAAIHAAITRAVRYPRLARAEGLEGRVIIRFRIDAAGQPREVMIARSAGDILDAAARDAVGRAAPFASAPGWVRVPVDFSLRAPP